jgi:hypothetical protein|tara:strand:- start:22 stop:165 length:144 start_codon:yes stop_codon:yes gene_type:complete
MRSAVFSGRESKKAEMPEWSKGADLRPADASLVGSNPTFSIALIAQW